MQTNTFWLSFGGLSLTVTLKIRSRSPKPIQLFIMSKCYIHANLVKMRQVGVGSGNGAGWLPVTGRPTTLAYGRAGACCACSRCGMGGLFFILFFRSRLSYLPFLMPHLLGDSWTF